MRPVVRCTTRTTTHQLPEWESASWWVADQKFGTDSSHQNQKAVRHLYRVLQEMLPGGADYCGSLQVGKNTMALMADGLPANGPSPKNCRLAEYGPQSQRLGHGLRRCQVHRSCNRWQKFRH